MHPFQRAKLLKRNGNTKSFIRKNYCDDAFYALTNPICHRNSGKQPYAQCPKNMIRLKNCLPNQITVNICHENWDSSSWLIPHLPPPSTHHQRQHITHWLSVYIHIQKVKLSNRVAITIDSRHDYYHFMTRYDSNRKTIRIYRSADDRFKPENVKKIGSFLTCCRARNIQAADAQALRGRDNTNNPIRHNRERSGAITP